MEAVAPEDVRPAATRRATIKDVAQAAQVSRSTASRALTGTGYVAAHVRDRVRRAAENLGYVPDVLARNLRQQATKSIGVLVSDLRNPFYADLASGIGRLARQHGFLVLLADDMGAVEQELEAAEMLVAVRVTGVILTPVSADVTAYFQRHRVPVVEVDRQFAAGAADAVLIDNQNVAFEVTRQLIGLGHQRIALFVDELHWTTGRDRLAGYRRALEEARLPFAEDLVVRGGWDATEAEGVAHALLAQPSRPTAIFAANNVLAEGVWRAAQALGVRIPEELSLATFDDAPWMTMVRPGVTAVAQDAVVLGEAALLALLQRLESPAAPVRTVMLSARVEQRGSVATPQQRG